MKHQVIHSFRDIQDNNHIYKIGDRYPHKGRVNKVRLEELSSTENKIGVPLIKEISDEGDE